MDNEKNSMTTKDRTRTVLTLAAVAMVSLALLAAPASALTVVYQDAFDDDGIDVNTGVGGGLNRYARQGDTWVDNGDLIGNSTGGNDRGNVWSLNSFDLSAGFSLEVSYTIDNIGAGGANRVIIGLIDALPETQTNTTYITHFLADNQSKSYGIGMNMTTDTGPQGLNFADNTGSVTPLSNEQTILTGTHTFLIEMDTESNWSYSIDGATATTGTIAGEGFDLTRDFQFFAYVQDYRYNKINLHSATLSTLGSAILDGDADGDGDVDAADYIMVKTHFGGPPAADTDGSGGDFNDDGTVDWDDLQSLMDGFNTANGTETIPEPATLLIMMAAGLPALLKRRRS